ncbi:hypothetical protein [Pseudomonas marginalis]|uniref:hypothetical protein n=1 Tax=Pseudomonas marginalis TaxID=298 RepID=UPI0034D3FAB6
MLSILYPEIMNLVNRLPVGLLPVTVKADSVPKLIVKASKELILTAKLRRGFSIHLIPYEIPGVKSIGFLAAFYDDPVHPYTTGGALIKELSGRDFAKLFLSRQVDVHFFDELGREMLAYRAEFKSTKKHRDMLRSAVIPSAAGLNQSAVISALTDWFRLSTEQDDKDAIKVIFKEALIPEDIVHVDMRNDTHRYQGAPLVSTIPLERPEPGEFQEKEIIALLQRVFRPEQIYLAPKRTYDREEVADVLVVTDKYVVVIQAKDSPNIERIVNNGIERKRKTSFKALVAAAGQVKGAIAYIRRPPSFAFLMGADEVKVDLAGKELYSLVVIKELFDVDYGGYSPAVLDVFAKTGIACIPLSYGELHQYTSHIHNEDEFFNAFMKVFEHGLEKGKFPRQIVLPAGSVVS